MGYNSIADSTSFFTPKSAEFRENSNLQQFKVIRGHRSWCQSKQHVRLHISHYLVIVTLDVYPSVFNILTFRKWLVFLTPV